MTSAVEVDRVVLGFCLLTSSNVVDFHHLKFCCSDMDGSRLCVVGFSTVNIAFSGISENLTCPRRRAGCAFLAFQLLESEPDNRAW